MSNKSTLMTTEIFLKRKKCRIRLYEYVCCLNGTSVAAWGFEIFKLDNKEVVPAPFGGLRGYVTQADAILDAGAAVDALVFRKITAVDLDVIPAIQERRKAYWFLGNHVQVA